jgi:hypothetical protein
MALMKLGRASVEPPLGLSIPSNPYFQAARSDTRPRACGFTCTGIAPGRRSMAHVYTFTHRFV